MKTIQGLLSALGSLKPTHHQLLLVTAFYTDARVLKFFVDTHAEDDCPFFWLQNDHCLATVTLLLSKHPAMVEPLATDRLSASATQELTRFIGEDTDGLRYYEAITQTLLDFPAQSVSYWISAQEGRVTIHFGVDGRALIRLDLDAAQAMNAAPAKAARWPFKAGPLPPLTHRSPFLAVVL